MLLRKLQRLLLGADCFFRATVTVVGFSESCQLIAIASREHSMPILMIDNPRSKVGQVVDGFRRLRWDSWESGVNGCQLRLWIPC